MPKDSTGVGDNAGSVSVYTKSPEGWSLQQRLFASDAAEDEEFGRVVDVDGDTIVVGAPFEDTPEGGTFPFGRTNIGAVYVFERDGTAWSEVTKLQSSDGGAFDEFGTSISLSGDTLLIGAPLSYNPDIREQSGSAYLFVRSGNTWSEVQKLSNPEGRAGDRFGDSVSLADGVAAVGAPGEDLSDPGSQFVSNIGRVHLFKKEGSTWTEDTIIPSPRLVDDVRFGTAVATDGVLIAVGAPNVDGFRGDARVYTRSDGEWLQDGRLIANNREPDDCFGASLAINGNRVLVGSPKNGVGFVEYGSAYLFTRGEAGWNLGQQIGDETSNDGRRFGQDLDFDDNTIVCGVPTYMRSVPGRGGINDGSAFAFETIEKESEIEVISPEGTPFQNGAGSLSLGESEVGVEGEFLNIEVGSIGRDPLDCVSARVTGSHASDFELFTLNFSEFIGVGESTIRDVDVICVLHHGEYQRSAWKRVAIVSCWSGVEHYQSGSALRIGKRDEIFRTSS